MEAPQPAGSRAPTFIVALSGELDLARKAELMEFVAAFRRSGATDIEIDLRRVEFLDSTALMSFGLSLRLARARGGRLRLCGPQQSVRRALDVSGFGALCDVVVDSGDVRTRDA